MSAAPSAPPAPAAHDHTAGHAGCCGGKGHAHADDQAGCCGQGHDHDHAPIAAPQPEVDLGVVDEAVRLHGRKPESLIPILQHLQRAFRWLPPTALQRVCAITDIHPTAVAGVSTFYDQFRHLPAGRHLVSVCHGTACHVKGADLITSALRRHLKMTEDQDTDADGNFTLHKIACLGCCTLAPVAQVGAATYGHLTPEKVSEMLDDVLERERTGGGAHTAAKVPVGKGPEIRVGSGSCCVANGSQRVREALERELERTGSAATIKAVGCVGMCHETPMVEVVDEGSTPTLPDKSDGADCGSCEHNAKGVTPWTAAGAPGTILYTKVHAEDAAAIIRLHLKPRTLWGKVRRFADDVLDRLSGDAGGAMPDRRPVDVRDPHVNSFLGDQMRIATEHSGEIEPLDLDEYLAHDGFAALKSVLAANDPDALIKSVLDSGVRGRGGAGFPTGRKWAATRAAKGTGKFIVCNGDEGDPGAFMDRMILESFPYRVLEGMAIAAQAIGAYEGVLYIRAEYPLAVVRIREAIARLVARGFLGDKLMGNGPPLHLRVVEGAGAFVCGEETALLASVEGKRGMPRLRPPFPAESGLWGRPTCVNNVETLALIPWIVRKGGSAFASIGTKNSTGTKVFALAGKIARGGLIEVPMGLSMRRVVEGIGGGVPGGHRFKAVQIGGPSGGCLPAELCDLPIDYDALNKAGAIMGSGGLVVLDERDCMVDISRYFLKFTQEQSCGKCTFCRLGTKRMLDILDRLCAGKGKPDDLKTLEVLAGQVKAASLCGLGQTAPNPVLTTLRYFRAEYEAHLAGKCPAGKCTALIRYVVQDGCTGCTKCAQICPVEAIGFTPYQKHFIDTDKCTRCDLCRSGCPEKVITVES